jgi:hypothetical protein
MAVFWVVVPCSLVEVYFYQTTRSLLLPDYTALQPRRQPCSYSPLREPQIRQKTKLFFQSFALNLSLVPFPKLCRIGGDSCQQVALLITFCCVTLGSGQWTSLLAVVTFLKPRADIDWLWYIPNLNSSSDIICAQTACSGAHAPSVQCVPRVRLVSSWNLPLTYN